MSRRQQWVDTVEKIFSHRRAQILTAVGAPTRKLLGGTRRQAVNSPATSVVELRAYRMAIAACFVFQREISRSVFWDFFDSIGHERKHSLCPIRLSPFASESGGAAWGRVGVGLKSSRADTRLSDYMPLQPITYRYSSSNDHSILS